MKCTFGGIWNGGGGDGQKHLFVASFFFDRAAEVILLNGDFFETQMSIFVFQQIYIVSSSWYCHWKLILDHCQAGFVDSEKPTAKVKPAYFKKAAKLACQLSVEDAKTKYPLVQDDNLPYLCMDLVYQYTLLVDGFGTCNLSK